MDTTSLIRQLTAEIKGQVLSDPVSLGLYATDASLYQIMPLAVVVPLDRADAVQAVRIAAQHNAPILPRAGGTSLSGQTIAEAVVIDVSKHMNRLLELNVAECWARVEPGLVRDELNAMLKPHGLHYAPDPATSSRANVGGMIANNAAGMRSIRYGTSIDHLLACDVALSTGDVLNLGALDEDAWRAKEALGDREGELYREFHRLIEANADEIVERFPKVRRRSGGYPLDAFVGPFAAHPWNLARILSGSEGTLGLILEARVNLEPLPKVSGLLVSHFDSVDEALSAVAPVVDLDPSAVELIDHTIIDTARGNLLTRDTCGFIEGTPRAMLIIEAQGEEPGEVSARLEAMAQCLRDKGLGFAHPLMLDARTMADVWLMRKNGLGLMTTVKGDRKPVPFIEDAALPLDVLPEYIKEIEAICRRHDLPVALYAHASVGLIHVRPMLDMHRLDDIEQMKQIQEEVFGLVTRYKGSWSGEHGDGIVRGGFNRRFFGDQLYEAFRDLKRLFDPAGLMNPGKIVDTPPVDSNLRYGEGYVQQFSDNVFHYREDGGLRQAVEQCTGVGACRQTLSGTMCPSYIATRDEEHSTRGRANALRLAMTGQLGPDAMSGKRLNDVFELCLSCKGCKNECPNNVDMARLKAEVLNATHRRGGSSARDKLFRDSSRSAALASGALASMVNTFMGLPPLRLAMDKFLGVERRRHLPVYTNQPLSRWFRRTRNAPQPTGDGRPRVALFNDTYLENYEPHVGRAAVEVLEAAGYSVELVSPGCCQRPAMSKGFLDEAKVGGTRTMRNLDVYASQGIPILVCEPSCASSLTDDLPDLIDDEALGARVSAQVKMIDVFLEEALAVGLCQLPWRDESTKPMQILVHGHCHQKALYGTSATLGLLGRIPGAQVELIDAGCCGMAGSFGYEKEHYELSMKIGEDRLFPALRRAPAQARIVASGFSCRHQIYDGVGRKSYHVIELVREALSMPVPGEHVG